MIAIIYNNYISSYVFLEDLYPQYVVKSQFFNSLPVTSREFQELYKLANSDKIVDWRLFDPAFTLDRTFTVHLNLVNVDPALTVTASVDNATIQSLQCYIPQRSKLLIVVGHYNQQLGSLVTRSKSVSLFDCAVEDEEEEEEEEEEEPIRVIYFTDHTTMDSESFSLDSRTVLEQLFVWLNSEALVLVGKERSGIDVLVLDVRKLLFIIINYIL